MQLAFGGHSWLCCLHHPPKPDVVVLIIRLIVIAVGGAHNSPSVMYLGLVASGDY
jgi:hypothetical protein